MNPARDLFFSALDKPPEERETFLESACGTDLDLRKRVAALLAAHLQADPVLDRPAVEALSGDARPDSQDVLAPLAPSPVAGAVGQLGHYTVFEVVGRGGMGVVLRAFDEKLHREVAIKVLPPASAASDSARRRFVREARAAAAVRHENVVAIHAVEDGDPVPYLVMAFVEGGTLQDRIDRGPPLALAEILRIGIQVADGLAAAHRQGLVHRDVKPANILLEAESGRALLTDFGLARTVDNPALTQHGLIAGTPQYMSPEQVNGGRVGPASDLFSLGSVLYAMCAGRPPFQAPITAAVLKLVSDAKPKPLREVNPTVPRRLDALVRRLHAQAPDARFADAGELAAALRRMLDDLTAGRDLDLLPRPRRRWLIAAGVGVLLATVGLAVAFRHRLGEKPDPVPVAPAKPEWVSLFNGKDLTGWRVDPTEQGQWTVEEGEIVTRRANVHPLLSERDDYGDFHLRMRIRPVGDGTAVVVIRQFRATVELDQSYSTGFRFQHLNGRRQELVGGMVHDVLDKRKGRLGMGPVRYFNPDAVVPTDDPWPLVEVICQGTRVRILASGQTLADLTGLGKSGVRGAIGLKGASRLGNPQMDVRFKDIEIRELDGE